VSVIDDQDDNVYVCESIESQNEKEDESNDMNYKVRIEELLCDSTCEVESLDSDETSQSDEEYDLLTTEETDQILLNI
jgi:hypothetical protein